MGGFVSSPAQASAPTLADLVAGDDFYPGVKIADARDALRLPTQVTDGRLRDALRSAMISVRRQLAAWKIDRMAAGAQELADCDLEEVDGVPALELLYRRAVISTAAADLAETHHDISATNDGKGAIEGEVISAGDHRRNATHAIRDILGDSRIAVELI